MAPLCTVLLKTVYLIRHAESVENVRMNGLYNVGRSLKRGRLPSIKDVYDGSKFLATNAIGKTNSVLSEKGRRQVEEMYSILFQENFTDRLDLIAHSPLTRAKDTCYGVLDVSQSSIPVLQLNCLREVTPRETLLQGRRPVKQRIDQLHTWMEAQTTADTIALVGHSEYFLVMLGLTKKFQNCDVWKASYQTGGHWTDLTLQYRVSDYQD